MPSTQPWHKFFLEAKKRCRMTAKGTCYEMVCRFVGDVFVMTKKQVNKMIRMKAKYEKSTKHFPHVIP